MAKIHFETISTKPNHWSKILTLHIDFKCFKAFKYILQTHYLYVYIRTFYRVNLVDENLFVSYDNLNPLALFW